MSRPVSQANSPNDKARRATATIDELTSALADFSRSTTPENAEYPRCSCCDKENCETVTAWANDRAKLQRRLVLSAEIGQALLQRHEAYLADHNDLYNRAVERSKALENSNDQVVSRMADLIKSNTQLDKRLTQSQLNLEVAESSNRALLREVQDSRLALSRFTAQAAHANRTHQEQMLSMTQERDDLAQELQSEINRARTLEAKSVATNNKCESLEAEVNRLLDQLEEQRLSQRQMSEDILQDARARLEMLHNSLGQPVVAEDPDVTRVLETLVADNEALKRDNAELQNMLAESRSELRSLADELQEHRAVATSPPPPMDVVLKSGSPPPPSTLQHMHRRRSTTPSLNLGRTPRPSEGWAASFSNPHSPPPYQRGFSRTSSPLLLSFPSRGLPPHPDSRSPADGTGSDYRFRRSTSPSSSIPYGTDIDPETDVASDFDDREKHQPAKAKRRTLMLLSRSRGVQTDPEPTHVEEYVSHQRSYLMPGHRRRSDTLSSHSGQGRDTSDTSSLQPNDSSSQLPGTTNSELPPSILSELLERLAALLARLNQADVTTLSARLKRQHIAGGDVGHLSRSTINGIISDVSSLRTQFRTALEAEKHDVTRKEIRALLRFAKDVFTELGKLRATVNDVMLDPNVALKLKEGEREPSASLGLTAPGAVSAVNPPERTNSAMGWIAPISKLFASGSGAQPDAAGGAGPSQPGSLRRQQSLRPPTRAAPKLAAAVSSSTATVSVEFADSRMRRVVSLADPTSTLNTSSPSSGDNPQAGPSHPRDLGTLGRKPSHPRRNDLLGIFAGAPSARSSAAGDSWVVVPDRNRRLRGASSTANFGTPSTDVGPGSIPDGNATLRVSRSKQLSRNVDAVIDSMQQREGSIIAEEIAGNYDDEDGERNADASDFKQTMLERTRPLRRGLSDSSIHSTFLATPVNRLISPAGLALAPPQRSFVATGESSFGTFDRQSVLATLSKKVQSFTTGYYPSSSSASPVIPPSSLPRTSNPESTSTSDVSSSSKPLSSSPPRPIPQRSIGLTSPRHRDISRTHNASVSESTGGESFVSSFIPSLAAWASPLLDHDDEPIARDPRTAIEYDDHTGSPLPRSTLGRRMPRRELD